MTPERWKRIDELYNAALDRPADERKAFLANACADDPSIREYVESLLREAHDTIEFLERPAIEVEAQSLAKEARKTLPDLGGRYVVLNEAGRGGMGTVYRVRDKEADDVVALKVLNPEIVSDQTAIERLKSELRLARRVTHRNICRMYDISRVNDVTFISMEFVEGESLRRVLHRLGSLTVRKGIEVIRQIGEGLREAHSQGIIHRDLKPENIMIDESGNVKVMDFGIARLISSEPLSLGVRGTASYMSPEQAEGKALDARSDIYSLGLVMYEIFTGRMAFSGDTPIAVALKQVRETPPNPRTVEPTLPPDIETIILRCIEKSLANRYQSLDELLAALTPGQARPARASEPKTTTKISTWFHEDAYVMDARKARPLLMVVQAGYLALYFAVLFYLEPAVRVLQSEIGLSRDVAAPLLVVSAMAGIAARIFLMSAVAFDHPATGRQFWKLFPALLILDAMWAASPLLLAPRIGIGIALGCAAMLAYLPFSQKTLVSNAFR
jgi:hypothetical protein